MTDEIYIVADDRTLTELHAEDYDSEDLLQELLAEYPNLLAGAQLNPADPRRWLLVRREMGIGMAENAGGRWSVDHVFLDQDGVPTLVEVKRGSDSRIRREVVGQMLDYAANAVVYWPTEEIRSRFEARCEAEGDSAEEVIADFLGADSDAEVFWDRVRTNLRAGKIRLLFVADKVPPELQRIVEFLNTQMNPAEVLALEIRQYMGAGLRTLVPRVIGQTAEAMGKRAGSSRETRQWDESSFFSRMSERNVPEETNAAREVLRWAQENTSRVWWGTGKVDGSFGGVFVHRGVEHPLFAVYASGPVETYFQWLKGKPAFEDEGARLDLLAKLNEIPGVAFPPSAITKRPSVRLEVLATEGRLRKFLKVLEWAMDRIRLHGQELP